MIPIAVIVVIVAIVIDWPRQGAKGGSRLANTSKVGLIVVWIVVHNDWRNDVAFFSWGWFWFHEFFSCEKLSIEHLIPNLILFHLTRSPMWSWIASWCCWLRCICHLSHIPITFHHALWKYWFWLPHVLNRMLMYYYIHYLCTIKNTLSIGSFHQYW